MNKLSLLLAAAIGMFAASCSLLSGKTIVASPDNAGSKPASEAVGGTQTKPTTTKPTTPTHSHQQPSATTAASPLFGHLEGEWKVIAVGNKTVAVDEDIPYIYFEEAASKFYASNGCNVINGQYQLKGQEIMWSNVLATLRDCPHINFADGITRALADGTTVKAKIEAQGNEEMLYLTSTSGSKLLTLKRHNMQSLDGTWIVTSIDGTKVNDPEVNLYIDVPELKVHGNTGCNYFNGVILIDPHMPNSIQFSQMGVTMRMCPNADIERLFLVALESTQSYSLTHSGATLNFLNDKGHTVLTLARSKSAR